MKRARLIAALISTAVLVPNHVTAANNHVTAPSAGTPSDTVRQAQFILISHGYVGIGPADNILGPLTRHGLVLWQRANGLPPTGQPDAATMRSLLDSVAVRPAAPVPVAAVPAVRVAPAVVVPLGQTEGVEAVIRDVWPDDLEDRAVAIATRESRLQPGVRNACCWGLMQIHWKAHRSWLAQFGVTSPEQLLDARTNAEMAYQLYLIDGWAPWSL